MNNWTIILIIVIIIAFVVFLFALSGNTLPCCSPKISGYQTAAPMIPPPPTPTPIDISVEVRPKTIKHPFFAQGSMMGYVVNGVEGLALDLKRNTPYRFVINNEEHPLYFTSGNTGGKLNYDTGYEKLSNSFTTPTMVVFGSEFPNNFYYQCALHEKMGYTITLS